MSVFTLAHGTAGSRWELNSMDVQQVRSPWFYNCKGNTSQLRYFWTFKKTKLLWSRAMLTPYRIPVYLYTFRACIAWTAVQNWIRYFTHFKHRSGVVDRPPQWFQCSVHTAPKCETEPIQYVTLHLWDRRGAAQLRSITEIAPKSPFLCVNRGPIRYEVYPV